MQTKTLGILVIVLVIGTLLVSLCLLKSGDHYEMPHYENQKGITETLDNNIEGEDVVQSFPTSLTSYLPALGLSLTYPGKLELIESKRIYSGAAVVSYDFKAHYVENKNVVFLSNVSVFTPESIQEYQRGCSAGTGLVEKPCLPESYTEKAHQSLKKGLTSRSNYEDYSYVNIDGVGYMVKSEKCSGDSCYNRTYTTFKSNVRIDTIVTIFDEALSKDADEMARLVTVD